VSVLVDKVVKVSSYMERLQAMLITIPIHLAWAEVYLLSHVAVHSYKCLEGLRIETIAATRLRQYSRSCIRTDVT
jgi:hypothetical protein